MAAIENRSTIRIRPQVAELSRRFPGLEPASIIKFARGSHILGRYRPILNNAGLQLFERVGKGPLSVPFIEDMIPELPSTAMPRLELYRHPFESVTGKAYWNFIESIKGYLPYRGLWRGVLDLASGCFHQCTMCGADSSASPRFMPYPAFLKILSVLPQHSADRLLLYDASDPLLWRDSDHDADYGDIVDFAGKLGYDLVPGITNGIIMGDPFSAEAAAKLGQAQRSMGLSIHLYQRRILEDAPDSELDKLAERYALTINLMGRARPILRSAKDPEVIRDFFLNRVVPRLSDEIRPRYADVRRFKVEPVLIDGRAADDPFFSGRSRHSIAVPRDDADGWVDECPSVFSTVDAYGNCFLSVYPPERPSAHSLGQRLVKDLFPSPDEDGFKWLLLKLKYVLNNKGMLHGSEDLTVRLWQEFTDDFDPRSFLGLVSSVDSVRGFSKETLLGAYGMIAELGVVSPVFFYNWSIGELCAAMGSPDTEKEEDRAADGFSSYLRKLNGYYNAKRDEVSFLNSFLEGERALKTLHFEELSPLPTISAFEFDPSLTAPKMRFPLPFRAQTGL